MTPVIVDLDASVLPLPGEQRLDYGGWQERLRFGCTRRSLADFTADLRARLPRGHGAVFLGSGDFHHLSLALLELCAEREEQPHSLDLLVLDNHPDAMRYPFGVHCGSWVARAAMLPWVRQVHVAGITSADIGPGHAWEICLKPLLRRKLCLWSVGSRADWLRLWGRQEQARSFADPDALVEALVPVLRRSPRLYCSIDKDVFAPEVVRTNWDQGVFALEHARRLLAACAGRLVGADVTGDVSVYAYRGLFKRLLTTLEGQPVIPDDVLPQWQEAQRAVNAELVDGAYAAWAGS